MGKRVKIVMAMVFVAAVGLAMWEGLHGREPRYEGKPLTQWLRGYEVPFAKLSTNSLPPSAWPEGKKADEVVRKLGTNAIPTLLRMIRAVDSPLKIRIVNLMLKQKWIKFNYVSADERNFEASRAFTALGTLAEPAVPSLITTYREHRSQESMNAVIVAFLAIGPGAHEAVPCVLEAAASTNINAVLALGVLRAPAETAVPVLTRLLGDADLRIRSNAAASLQQFGKDAKPAVPALLKLLSDQNAGPRGNARAALAVIDPDAVAKVGASANTPAQ